eukprot:CAMPEP_0206227924 /NCGR_PEP_ID=MMETSP0047_2-20121206/8891_1 /ASSEMBLY_ACC=CAM_ASM_000192 /TAXON_ID=195065 /ORGANISM="Chroomonas mesostigmatica_cf, Strain CCMP1168" /LENGTH=213 /DNA_ID=CAMNT_0053651125 /DNA_START=11 /DNA_END=652 /DNA_ORIENTATION=+
MAAPPPSVLVLVCLEATIPLVHAVLIVVPRGLLEHNPVSFSQQLGTLEQVLQDGRREDDPPAPEPPRHPRHDVLEIVVHVPNKDADQVHHWAGPQQHGKPKQHPGQPGRRKVEEPQEVHGERLIPPPPHVHHHEGEGRAEEEDGAEGCDAEHQRRPEEHHREEVGRLAAERGPLLEQPAVPHQEVHVEYKVQAGHAEEEEVGEDPPHLVLFDD